MQNELTLRLRRYYLSYTGLFVALILVLAYLERQGLSPRWIGYAFLFFTIMIYAVIGILSRTANVSEYYVAGRRVPAIYNGMATGADWMSAASFIGLAGTLYLSGYQGLAYVMGWTGGYVLVALLLAPIFAALANTPSLIFWPRAMAAMLRVWSACLPLYWHPLSTSWRRSMVLA